MNVFIKIIGVACLFLLSGCSRNFLDIKPDQSQVVPTTIRDLWAILDYTTIMNRASGHALSEMSTDDFFIDPVLLPLLSNPEQRNAYLWKADLYEGKEEIADWNGPYSVVLHANLVLERLESLERNLGNQDQWDQVKGSALFYRAWSFQSLAQAFCPTFNSVSAATDLGIPLRLESDITLASRRASVQETYLRIEKDLLDAAALLPAEPFVKTRPSKAAAYALLSRLYLIMAKYVNALEMANRSLDLNDNLLDYNEVDPTPSYPFDMFNAEVVFHANMSIPAILSASRLYVSPELYDDYDECDLRKVLYFRPGVLGHHYRGSYNGSAAFFTGLTTAELWLNKAEANARIGNHEAAVSDLNTLLRFRYKRNSFVEKQVGSVEGLLGLIILERRKELLFRGVRWGDLRRMNRESGFSQTLTREVGGHVHTLPPGDPRYVFPIPNEVIRITGMQQNPR